MTTPHPTIAGILAAWERLERHTVHVFCHPDDAAQLMAACGPLAWPYKVTPSMFVPAGQLYIYDPKGRTQS
ncbi:hypothetical protein AB0O28_18980 [Microbispora sp. NPDC088329]|uniref:hypothetical protein n=1 Tax=Microbispora sp. NPDC088329 TaxID=3154869 RepID=UPI003447DA1B